MAQKREKTKSEKTKGEATRAPTLAAYAEACTQQSEAMAKANYADGSVHRVFALAEIMAERADELTREFAAGRIPAHLELVSSKATFVTLFSAEPIAGYANVDLPASGDRTLTKRQRDALDKAFDGDLDALARRLEEDYGCIVTPFNTVYKPDIARQRAYHRAVTGLVETALRLAYGRYGKSSEAVRGFVKALRLLQPAPTAAADSPLGITEAHAEQAYDALLAAHAALWDEDYLAHLKVKADGN